MTARHGLWLPSLFWLAVFMILVALGTWQVQRLHWKEGLIAQRQAAVTGSAILLPETLDAAKGLEFHHVTLSGEFLNRDELYLHAIADGGTPGYHVITPFRLTDGNIVFVDRGFVPEDRRDPKMRAAGEIAGPTTVTGLLRFAGRDRSWFTPANEPARDLWFSIDLPAMAASLHLDHVLPLYVDADAAPVPGGYPRGGQTNTALPNDHLQYALTWYGLAIVCVIYYLLFVRGWVKERRL